MQTENKTAHISISLGVAAISFAVLIMELSMIRIMEVILAPNTGYMALTSAMFALGLGGIYLYLFPIKAGQLKNVLGRLAIGFSVFAPLVIFIFNSLPFGFEINQQNIAIQILCWLGMYVALVAPFFTAGLALALIFQTYSKDIGRLYFFDLVAAGLACLIFIPLMPAYGPGGLIFIASAASLVAFLCFSQSGRVVTGLVCLIIAGLVITPLVKDDYIEFEGHANKRGNDQMIDQGKRIMVKWDPVSKLDILNARPNALLFSIDGGTQGSWLGKFNGDFSYFDDVREQQPDTFFFGRNSIVHYLADSKGIDPDVLIIGSSAGGETKAAIAFGAKQIDAVELVGAIINSERNEFKDYGGGIYNHPTVTAIIGEGRSYLRSTDKRYDIIQMFSNHSTTSITQGATAAGVAYLQTVEAYLEYFEHLKEDGMMQINHHIYPRMLTTAAQAWHQSGRTEFWKHVLVIEPRIADTLPTLLLKMQPWSQSEIDTVISYVNRKKSFEAIRPKRSKPSERIYAGHPFETRLSTKGTFIHGLQFAVGTYLQNGLDYDVHVEVFDNNQQLIRQAVVPGRMIADNAVTAVNFEALIDTKGKDYSVRVSAPDATAKNGFSIWLAKDARASMNFTPGAEVPTNFIAFNPLDNSKNIVNNALLSSPFPQAVADDLPWDLTPVTDFSPFFSMIRKNLQHIDVGKENVLDSNTAYLLNTQLNNGYPKDWIHLIVVGAVSIIFSFIFIAIPLLRTNIKQSTWSGMSGDIIYFACLGLGFIMLQVVLIQIFHKLIGFPVHTFVLVISTMLLSAGLGSVCCDKFLRFVGNRTSIVFLMIIIYGLLFIFSFEKLFYLLLSYSLPVRLLCGAIMIAPLAFFMGMPFPIGILGLSNNNHAAIPWAWALNGFFTVLGGYLAIVISINSSFTTVLCLSLVIYAIALLVVRKSVSANETDSVTSESQATIKAV